jgi:DNA-binding transcriptional LysR family regulator
VKEFEDEQGYLFFERNGKRVAAITDSGQAFIRAIRPVLDDLRAGLERAFEMGRLISRQKAGSFLIGYSPLVPGAISEQVRSIRSIRFPALRLQFRTLAPAQLFDSLASGALQAAVMYGFPGRRDLEQIPIGSEQLHAVYRRDQNAHGTVTYPLEDLVTNSLVVPSSERMQPEIRDWLLEQCLRAGFKPKIVEEPSSTREAFDLIKDRAGVGVMPGGICDGMTESLESSPILGIGELQLVLAYKRRCNPRTQRIVAEFAHWLRQACLKKAN